jgi:hypothetical protein
VFGATQDNHERSNVTGVAQGGPPSLFNDVRKGAPRLRAIDEHLHVVDAAL